MSTCAAAPDSVVSFAGIDGADTFLNIPADLSDAQERRLLRHLATVERGRPWWIGDFALHFKAKADRLRAEEEALAKKESRKPKDRAYYADILSQALGISAGHIQNAADMSRFFPISFRNEMLTWQHHVAARRAVGWSTGTPELAVAWLEKAAAGGWTCADLRQNALPPIRPDAPPEGNPFDALDSADKWATQNKETIAHLDRDRAKNLLTRFHALIALVDHLRALTGAEKVEVLRENSKPCFTTGTQ